MIIFNEKKYVEDCLFGNKNCCIYEKKDAIMIIRYYIDAGKSEAEIREILKNIELGVVLECRLEDDYFYKKIFERASSRKLRVIESIPITLKEYEFVRSVNDVEKEKILFALLVLQKVFEVGKFYVPFKDIKKLSLSQKNDEFIQKAVYELKESGHLDECNWRKYKINTSMINNTDSETFLVVDDFDRITVPYLKTLKTEEYFFCEWCGRKIKRKKNDSNARRYCDKCSKIKNKYRLKM